MDQATKASKKAKDRASTKGKKADAEDVEEKVC